MRHIFSWIIMSGIICTAYEKVTVKVKVSKGALSYGSAACLALDNPVERVHRNKFSKTFSRVLHQQSLERPSVPDTTGIFQWVISSKIHILKDELHGHAVELLLLLQLTSPESTRRINKCLHVHSSKRCSHCSLRDFILSRAVSGSQWTSDDTHIPGCPCPHTGMASRCQQCGTFITWWAYIDKSITKGSS